MSGEIRWNVFRAALGSGEGSEQTGQRPVLIISGDAYNQVMPVVTILPLTSLKPGRRVYSNEALLPRGEANLPEDSLVLAHQVRTISKTRLRGLYGSVASLETRRKVEAALKIHLGLEE